MTTLDHLVAPIRPGRARTVTLGDITTESRVRNASRSISEVRSVTNDQGLVPTNEFFDNARTSSDTKDYKVVSPGMFVYNPSRINVGSIACLKAADSVIVSPMYVVFDVNPKEVLPDFLDLYLRSSVGRRHIEARTEVGARFRLPYASLSQIPITLPPVADQYAIVRDLGKFVSLIEALETERALRALQYATYRDELLLSPNSECSWLTLREVALDFGRGKSKHRPRNDPKLYGGEYPFIQTGDVRTSGHHITEHCQTYSEEGLAQSKLWPRGTICITIAANIAETGMLGFDACFPDSVIGVVVDLSRSSPNYVEYLLQSFKSKLAAKGRGSAQANINLATFENERFPFPPLEEQQRVVAILDKFESLAFGLESGLPAEIAARRSQYEYYRDKLLTLEEAVA